MSTMTNEESRVMTCEFCGEEVVSEEDYSDHLKLAHNLMKNIPLILERAVNKMARSKGKETIEEIVLLNVSDKFT